jgi:hypothetical protein
MVKLVLIVLMVALPLAASAAEETGPATRAWLNTNDVFHYRAHACNAPAGGITCGPDNLVNNPFTLLVRFDAPQAQSYTIYWIITDTEGTVALLEQATAVSPAGPNTLVLTGLSLPPSASEPFSKGLYKFISIVAGASGKISLSNYYPFRVLP